MPPRTREPLAGVQSRRAFRSSLHHPPPTALTKTRRVNSSLSFRGSLPPFKMGSSSIYFRLFHHTFVRRTHSGGFGLESGLTQYIEMTDQSALSNPAEPLGPIPIREKILRREMRRRAARMRSGPMTWRRRRPCASPFRTISGSAGTSARRSPEHGAGSHRWSRTSRG